MELGPITCPGSEKLLEMQFSDFDPNLLNLKFSGELGGVEGGDWQTIIGFYKSSYSDICWSIKSHCPKFYNML